MLPRGKLYWKSDFSTKSPTISILGMYWFLINFAKNCNVPISCIDFGKQSIIIIIMF
jgi:hypothetical protein